jgi:hypothetical protein
MAHRTVSGVHRTPGPRASDRATLGNFQAALRYNSLDCPVCTGHVRWANGATVTCANGRLQKVNSCEQCAAELRAEKSEHTGRVRCGTGLSGATTGQGFQRSTRSKPQRACWRGTHRTVNSDCPVHHRPVQCAHRQQNQSTARKWLEVINTPQPPPSMASKFSEVHIQYKSNSIHSKTHSKDQILSKSPNQLNHLVTWER